MKYLVHLLYMVSIILITLTLVCVVLVWIMRGLSSESLSELKRRARSGDINSARLYQLESLYQQQPLFLSVLLFLVSLSVIGLLSARSFSNSLTLLVVFVSYFVILIFGFSVTRTTQIASTSSIIIGFMLKFLSPLIKYPSKAVEGFIKFKSNKAFSSKYELLSLIEQISTESLLSMQERRAVRGALTYADKKIIDFMIPSGVVKSVKDSEILSPVVIGELHDSGFSRFPVFANSNTVVGTLYLKDAANVRSNKQVKEVMRSEVYYLNEQQTLQDALKAFLKTKHHLFMVVNSYEDVVGIITIEDVLEQIVGEKIIDEFDQYEDMKVIAKHLAEQKREERS